MIQLEETINRHIQPDVLSKFGKQKANREINSDMDVNTLSDIISDRLIEVVKKELKKIK